METEVCELVVLKVAANWVDLALILGVPKLQDEIIWRVSPIHFNWWGSTTGVIVFKNVSKAKSRLEEKGYL